MSPEPHAPDDSPAESAESLSLRTLEDQIAERMAQLRVVAEEFYKLQVLLDAIDGRDLLPVPDYLAGRVGEPVPHVDEQRRLEARRRAAQRIALVSPRQRR
jgi:hypothetical protein